MHRHRLAESLWATGSIRQSHPIGQAVRHPTKPGSSGRRLRDANSASIGRLSHAQRHPKRKRAPVPTHAPCSPVEVKQRDPFDRLPLAARKEHGCVVANRRSLRRQLTEVGWRVGAVLRLHDRDSLTLEIATEPVNTTIAGATGVPPDFDRMFQLKERDNQMLEDRGGHDVDETPSNFIKVERPRRTIRLHPVENLSESVIGRDTIRQRMRMSELSIGRATDQRAPNPARNTRKRNWMIPIIDTPALGNVGDVMVLLVIVIEARGINPPKAQIALSPLRCINNLERTRETTEIS